MPQLRSTTTILLTSLVVALVSYWMAVHVQYFHYHGSSQSFVPIHEKDAIVVTGAGSGIGKHAALSFAREGFTVFCGVRRLDQDGPELLKSANQWGIHPSKLRPILLDVTIAEQIEAAVEEVTSFVGEEHGLYGLFNNAATALGTGQYSVEDVSMEDIVRRVFEVNYFGLFRVTQAFLPLIRRRQGRIVSNTSVVGSLAAPFFSAYTSSKFAVEGLMDTLRRELLELGVHVSVLQTGTIQTKMLLVPFMDLFQTTTTTREEGVYTNRQIGSSRSNARLALKSAASPRVTSEAVIHAMRSPTPQTRYLVGGLSRVTQVLRMLPDRWVDFLSLAGETWLGGSITTEEELTNLINNVKNDIVKQDFAF